MKKILGLTVSLTVIAGVCAAVLAYLNEVTAEPIKATAAKNEAKAREEVLCGQKGYSVIGVSHAGYGGDIRLMVGFREDRKTIISYKVLQANETPGLGSKLSSPEFSGQFGGKDATNLRLRKKGGDIEAITSATITSKAVLEAIADARARAAKLD